MTVIYGLLDPRIEKIRYVGKTIMPVNRRLCGHVSKAKKGRTKTAVGDWIRSLLSDGVRPLAVVLTEVDDADWQTHERQWIAKFENLLNVSKGGNGAHTRRVFPSEYIKLLGKKRDADVGALVNLTREGVGYHRRKLGIKPFVLDRSRSFDHLCGVEPHNKITLPASITERLGKVSDTHLAKEASCSISSISMKRSARGIKKCRQLNHKGSKHGMSKLTENQVLRIRSLIAEGRTVKSLGEMFGVHISTVSNIKVRKTWRHV